MIAILFLLISMMTAPDEAVIKVVMDSANAGLMAIKF